MGNNNPGISHQWQWESMEAPLAAIIPLFHIGSSHA